MNARIQLLCGPSHCGKTLELIQRARAQSRVMPGSVLWLAPTSGSLRALRHRLLVHGGILGLRLGTIDGLVRELLHLHDKPALSVAQQYLILEECLALLTHRGTLRHFAHLHDKAGFIEQLRGTLSELMTAGFETDSDSEITLDDRQQELFQILAAYRCALYKAGHPDESQHHNEAARQAPQSSAPMLHGISHIVLDGFTTLTAGEILLLQALAQRVSCIHIALREECTGDRAELFQLTRETRRQLEQLGAEITWLSPQTETKLPAGLANLSRHLFRPLRRVEPSSSANGLELILAPGITGEVRLIARQIKQLLLNRTRPDDIDVVVRDLGNYSDILRDVFASYEVPLALDESTSLARSSTISLLLRALRLPDEDLPFTGLAAVLRHGAFSPSWTTPELPQKAETLLRMLAIPRGRDTYLNAVECWAEEAQPGLEDESAEESRRQRIHELARECRDFLTRFLRLWDRAPLHGRLQEHVSWLAWFAQELGLTQNSEDREIWEHFWAEITCWLTRDESNPVSLDRRTFLHRLGSLARHSLRIVATTEPGRVAVLTPEQARYRPTRVRFVLGLGERSFPRIDSARSLLDAATRDSIVKSGRKIGLIEDPLAGEMLLFHDILVQARERLILSYPAVDDRGQAMLPGSFLQTVRACFTPDAIPVLERRMLIERYLEDEPLSLEEYRVRVGASWPRGKERLETELQSQLEAASVLAQARFREPSFTVYDGMIQQPELVASIAHLFRPERILSPTALEDYISCPFRFLLRHVLRFEPLEDPHEEIEVTRRGMAFHRALSRLHLRLHAEGTHLPAEHVPEVVRHELALVIEEDIARAPGLSAKELWRLEGHRILRDADRYTSHWGKFLKPWQERGIAPRPSMFEVDFGMPGATGISSPTPMVIRHENVEVRIWGRIDRVDLAEIEDGIGFWIVDYKTGRAAHYTGSDLSAFRKLQLTLYALAVEGVLLQGKTARPLGLAYWLVSDGGPKVVLPGRSVTAWLDDSMRWPALREQLISWVTTLVSRIRRGQFPLAPRSEHCTLTCPYGQICRISQARSVGKSWDLPLPNTEEPAR